MKLSVQEMKKLVIVILTILLNLAVSAQIPSDTTLHIQITSRSKDKIQGVISNTQSDVLYEIQYGESRTNWTFSAFIYGPETTNLTGFSLQRSNLIDGKIRVRSWKDSWGTGIPDWWQFKYFGDVGVDAFANPMGDGYSNQQKFQNGMDPFKWYSPEGPQAQVTFQQGSSLQVENAILSWRCAQGPIPNTFTLERANRTVRGIYIPSAPQSVTVNGKIITNWPPTSLNSRFNWPFWARDNFTITGAFQIIAQVPARSNVYEYQYVDKDLRDVPPPVYRVRLHYREPVPFAELRDASAETIRSTILPVTEKQQANGYDVTVLRPVAHARYLLLVRDKNDRQWRASGFFVSSTNRNPVHLHVDQAGMMTDVQSPVSLPPVKFLPDVVQPEFAAGWGEDSDGDGLPDIYEVLVTLTKPDDPDTGDTGILDGFKIFADDGWNNWKKFRYRANPFQKYAPPPTVVLKEPTLSEMREAKTPPRTDMPFEGLVEIRTNAIASFQPYSLLNDKFLPHGANERARCDVRVSWHVPPPRP